MKARAPNPGRRCALVPEVEDAAENDGGGDGPQGGGDLRCEPRFLLELGIGRSAGIGALVVLIRLWGGLPEGVMYAILLMNALVPFIDRATQPRVFGTVRRTAT